MLTISLFTALFLMIIYWIAKHFTHWSARGIPQDESWTVLKDIFKTFYWNISDAETLENMCTIFPNKRYLGIYNCFTIPSFLVGDPDLIKQIAVENFDHFSNHTQVATQDPLWGQNLISLQGAKWKTMRATLGPLFTRSKMNLMFDTIRKCTENLSNHFESNARRSFTIEVKEVFKRYATDIITCVMLGVTCDSINLPENNFHTIGRKAIDFGKSRYILLCLLPKLSKMLNVQFYSSDIREFFKNLIEVNIEYRKRENIARADLINLLMEIRKGNPEHANSATLTNDAITAQILLLFAAGTKTVATTMSFMAYELALNSIIEKRLQAEIADVLNNNKSISYELIMKMKYLDRVVSETLRKWPPALQMDRSCTKQYTIKPTKADEKTIHLMEGDMISIPIYGLHRNSKFFHDPERFDPKRFNEENKSLIIPYTYVPFGIGPRKCLATRLALLEIKIAFFYILSKFDITVNEKTPVLLKLKRNLISLCVDGGIFLELKRRL